MDFEEICFIISAIFICIFCAVLIACLIINTISQIKHHKALEKIAKAELELEIAKMTQKGK